MKAVKQLELIMAMKTDNTARRYRSVLRDFCASLGVEYPRDAAIKALFAATSTEALEYMAQLRNRTAPDGEKLADATVANNYAVLKGIFNQLRKARFLTRNPFEEVQHVISVRQKHQKRPTGLVPFNKVFEIIEHPDKNTREGRMLRAMFAVMFGSGCRRSEIAALNVGDVMTTPKGTIYLKIQHTKGGITRNQPLPTWSAKHLSVWISDRKRDAARDLDPLFVSIYKSDETIRNRILVKGIYYKFKAHAEAVGVMNCAPHSARATSASMLKSLDFEDRDVAEFLGHANTRMVGVYDKRARNVENHIGLTLDYDHAKKMQQSEREGR